MGEQLKENMKQLEKLNNDVPEIKQTVAKLTEYYYNFSNTSAEEAQLLYTTARSLGRETFIAYGSNLSSDRNIDHSMTYDKIKALYYYCKHHKPQRPLTSYDMEQLDKFFNQNIPVLRKKQCYLANLEQDAAYEGFLNIMGQVYDSSTSGQSYFVANRKYLAYVTSEVKKPLISIDTHIQVFYHDLKEAAPPFISLEDIQPIYSNGDESYVQDTEFRISFYQETTNIRFKIREDLFEGNAKDGLYYHTQHPYRKLTAFPPRSLSIGFLEAGPKNTDRIAFTATATSWLGDYKPVLHRIKITARNLSYTK